MMYSYEVKGTDSRDQTWTVSGNVLAPENADALTVCDMVGREGFAKLTQGKAVYGDPGRGCRGPYKITEFTWRAMKQ